MNISKIVVAMGGSSELGLALATAADKFGVVMEDHWLAQIYVESAGFKKFRENLNYKPERLLAVFPGRNGLRTIEQARKIVAGGRDAIAEAVYGGVWGAKHLGNIYPGDGAKFAGAGAKQLTGRYNFNRYSMAMYGDDRCVREPGRLQRMPDAALSAGWFWKDKRIDAAGDDINKVTRLVNGGLNGLQDRKVALGRVRSLA